MCEPKDTVAEWDWEWEWEWEWEWVGVGMDVGMDAVGVGVGGTSRSGAPPGTDRPPALPDHHQ